MGIARGTNIVMDNLVYGYDSGYNVADNNTATRFYPGEPTTNVTPLTDVMSTSNWTGGGWQGSIAVSSDYSNTLEITAYNGWRTFAINHGITSGGTVSVSFQYRLKSFQTMTVFGIVLNGRNLGNYHNDLGQITNSNLRDSQSGWKTFNGSFTANNNTYGGELCIGLRGSDNGGNTETMYIRNLQVELKGHQTPYTSSSRSSTASLVDLKRTASINVNNISFDSTGQPDYDGSNDYLRTTLSGVDLNSGCTIEGVLRRNTTPTAWRTFFNLKPTGSNTPFFEFRSGGNSQQIYADYYNGTDYYTPAGSLTTGEFGHAVSCYDCNGNIKIYLNGSLVGTKTGVPAFALGTSPVLSVGIAYSNDRYTDISAPVVKVYDAALSATQVEQNYRAYKNRFNI